MSLQTSWDYTQYFKKLFLVLATGDRKIYDTGISSRIYDAVGEKRPTYMKNKNTMQLVCQRKVTAVGSQEFLKGREKNFRKDRGRERKGIKHVNKTMRRSVWLTLGDSCKKSI